MLSGDSNVIDVLFLTPTINLSSIIYHLPSLHKGIGILIGKTFLGGEEGAMEAALPPILASVGGVMIGVCIFELWPEARLIKNQGRPLFYGMLLGALLMLCSTFFLEDH